MWVRRVENGAIDGPRGAVLSDLTLELQPGVTALVGPSGSGKSALLRALASQPPAPGWRVHGRWERPGAELAPFAPCSIRWLPQERYRQPHPHESFSRPPAVSSWQEVLERPDGLALLDEPLRGGHEDDEEALVAHLKKHAREGGSAVVVTHNLRFARAIADRVLFVCAGTLRAACDGQTFFHDPPSELAAKFVQEGNCSLAPTPPALPTHFRWIREGALAGMGRPGLLGEVEDDLTAVANAGIALLVSLTERPFDAKVLRSFGIQARHLAIKDMGVPPLGRAASLCGHVDQTMKSGRAVAYHCRAGLGRTGTMLAAQLVWEGTSAERAIERVREVCPHYIQRPAQIRFVHQFAERHG